MKLIIDIPERDYKNVSRIADMGFGTNVDEAIKNGTPLDDVKAEFKTFTVTEKSEYDIGLNDAVLKCFNVLDNIGKAESEVICTEKI